MCWLLKYTILYMEDLIMALYDYQCKDCGEKAEYLVFSENDSLSCVKCGSKNLERLLSSYKVGSISVSGSDSPASSGASCPYGGCCGG